MGAADVILGIALLAGLALLLVGIYSLGLQRKAVGTQDNAMDRVAHSIKLQEEGIERAKQSLEMQAKCYQLQVEGHQLAQEALALQRENNMLLRELLSQSGNSQTGVE